MLQKIANLPIFVGDVIKGNITFLYVNQLQGVRMGAKVRIPWRVEMVMRSQRKSVGMIRDL